MGSGQSSASDENAVMRIGRQDDHGQLFKKPIEDPRGEMTRSVTNLSIIDTTVKDEKKKLPEPRRDSTGLSSAFGTEEVKPDEEVNGDPIRAFKYEDTIDSIKLSNKKKEKQTTPEKMVQDEDDDIEILNEGKKIEEDVVDFDDVTLRRQSVVGREDTIESNDMNNVQNLATKRQSIDRRQSTVSHVSKAISVNSVKSVTTRPNSSFRGKTSAASRQGTARGSIRNSALSNNGRPSTGRRNSTAMSDMPKGILKKSKETTHYGAPQNNMPNGPEHGEKLYNDTKLPYSDGFGGAAVVIRASNQAGEPGRVIDPNNLKRVKGKLYDLFREREFKLVHPTNTTEHETDTGEVFLRLGYQGKAKLWAKLKNRKYKVKELETFVYFRESRTGDGITYTVRLPTIGEYRLEVNIIDGPKNSLKRIADFVIHCTAVTGNIRQFPVTNGTIVMFPTVALMSPTHREIQRNRKINFKILVKDAKHVNVVTIPSHDFMPLYKSKVEDHVFEGTFIFDKESDKQVHLMGSLKKNTHSPMYEYVLIEKQEIATPREDYLAMEHDGKLTPIKEIDEELNTPVEAPMIELVEEDPGPHAPYIEGF